MNTLFKNTKCPYFGSCGGCSLQHVPYKTQVEQKKNFVLWQLMTNIVEVPKDVKVYTADQYGYRSRMDFAFSKDGPGLRRKESFSDIIPIEQCPISQPKLNALLKEVWGFYTRNKKDIDIFDPRSKRGTLKYATIRTMKNSGDSSITFIVNSESPKLIEQQDLIAAFAAASSAANVIGGTVGARQDLSVTQKCHPLKGTPFLEEKLLGKRIRFHSQAFFQNNTATAEKMLQHCRAIFKKYKTADKTLVDLYGGAGTFGITLADMFKKLLIIDSDGANIKGAAVNLDLNNIKNAEARCADARIIGESEARDLMLVIDPPRAGLHPKLVKKILDLKAEVMVYVSCNPSQMAKELAQFQQQYTIKSLGIFDHFPQTPHIEAIAELVIRK